jgi:hypothetical protein
MVSLKVDRVFEGCFKQMREELEGLYRQQMGKLRQEFPRMEEVEEEEEGTGKGMQEVQQFLKKLN